MYRTQKLRIGYIDELKGFGIFLMIIGHIGIGSVLQTYIHSFHMQLFFFLSGYFFDPKSDKFIMKKIKVLLIPYLAFGFFFMFWKTIFYSSDLVTGVSQILWINNAGLPIAGALWFLTCLFIVDLVAYILLKFLPKKICIIIIVAISIFGSLRIVKLPWSADTAMVGLGIFAVGYLTGHTKIKNIVLNDLSLYILFLLTIITGLVNGYVNLRTNSYGFIPLFWINAIFIPWVYLNIFRRVSAIRIMEKSRVHKWLAYQGKNSITYICINQFVIFTLTPLFSQFATMHGKIIVRVFILVVTIFICYVTNELFLKTRLKVLIGK